MKFVVLDSCSLINMINGDVFEKLSLMEDFLLYVGELVCEECFIEEDQKKIIETAINLKYIKLLQGISIYEFKYIKDKYQLGDGESESIALAKKLGYFIATDDKKARNSVIKEIGTEYLTGSLYLLREMVKQKILTCDESLLAYKKMKVKGGFLPFVDKSYLCIIN